jgi:hypothetical protein
MGGSVRSDKAGGRQVGVVMLVCVPAQRQRREEPEDLDGAIRDWEGEKGDNVRYIRKARYSSDLDDDEMGLVQG